MSWLTNRGPADEPGVARGRSRGPLAASLQDDFLEGYVCWREACQDVHMAYERWGRSERPDRGRAFAAYRAALDREDCAARVYAEAAEQLRARQR
jgi:hypothetical protein